MKILFIRHGNPDYKNDCLTELGHLQAQAVAERLAKEEKIDAVYTSTNGRAFQTGQYIARAQGLEVEQAFDFIREMDWSVKTDPTDWKTCSPWLVVGDMIKKGKPMTDAVWSAEDRCVISRASDSLKTIGLDFDEFLKGLGYTREGLYYRVGKPKYDTVVMVSHAGASSCVFSHLFNLQFPFVLGALTDNQKCTSITEVYFVGEEGALILPRFGVVNDAKHIKGLQV